MEITVRGHHLDLYQHVNNARYLEFLEEARWSFFADYGNLPRFLLCDQALIVVNIDINYRQAGKMNDRLKIETSIKSLKRRAVIMQQQITLAKNHKLIADAQVSFIVLNKQQNKVAALDGELKSLLEMMYGQQQSIANTLNLGVQKQTRNPID